MAKLEQKLEQILVVDPPNELKFKGPFTSPVTSYIKLTNPSDKKVCFKIKTTAPKRYCVRPNSGVLDPQSYVEIAVSLQPFDFDTTEKNKHKFMVQSIIAPQADEFNLDLLWKDASSDILMDSKLKCVFEMPSEEDPQAAPIYSLDREDLKKKNTSSINSADSSEPEILKANVEIIRLREELSSAQRQNLELREDLLKAMHSDAPKVSNLPRNRPTQQAYASESNQITPALYLGLGVIIGLLSMFLGKYIF